MIGGELPPDRRLITRREVIDALKAAIRDGATDHVNIPTDLPSGQIAQELLDNWTEQERSFALRMGTHEARYEFSFERLTLPIDAGFTDPLCISETIGILLEIELPLAKSAGLTGLVEKIEAKIIALQNKNRPN